MKNDFPLLQQDIVYLDSAATSQKPQVVIDSISEFYSTINANAHRGIYPISVKTSQALEQARETIAKFINTTKEHIIFTKNTTESLNLLAYTLTVKNDENIVTTEIEHHSNFVPFQELAKHTNSQLRVARYNKQIHELESIVDLVDEKTKIVTFSAMSNVSGKILDIKNIISQIREKNNEVIIILDCCQYAVHNNIDVHEIDCDYLAFSAHKLYGPLGVGILYAKNLDNKLPFLFGGDMIESVSLEKTTFAQGPQRFEAGTIDSANIIATAKAIEYLQSKDLSQIRANEEELKNYALEQLRAIENITIIGHNNENYGSIISLYHNSISALDLAQICADKNICVRVGQHCAEPFLQALGVKATLRVSIAAYTTKEDIDKCIEAIKEGIKLFTR